MIPALTYPLALAGLLALPALAAIYFLRRKHRRLPVSSLLLWRQQLKTSEGGAKLERPRLPWIFFLELFILALLIFAATGPRWQLPETTRPLIILLDDSASMLAGGEGNSPRVRAEQRLKTLLHERKFHSIRLLIAGSKPRLAGPAITLPDEIPPLLAQWTCRAPAAAIEDSLAIATDLGRQEAQILVLTDHAPPHNDFTGGRVRWLAFGRAATNLAFVNATRSVHGEEDRCLLEIANHSTSPQSPSLTIRSGTNTLYSGSVPIAPRSRERIILNLPAATPSIEAVLGEDALAADNRVWLAPHSRRRVRVQLAVEDEPLRALLERTLAATGLRAAQNTDQELLLHTAPQTHAGAHAWNLRLLTSTNSIAYTGPFVLDPIHPLVSGLAIDGVIWSAANTTNAPGFLPVISAGNVPLLSTRADALGRHQLQLVLDLAASTLPSTPNWPVLLHNLLQWRLQESPGLHERNFHLGQPIAFRAGAGPHHWQPPGDARQELAPAGCMISLEAQPPGLHRIFHDNTAPEFAVNFVSNAESDLAGALSGQWGDWNQPDETHLEYASVIWIFLLVALVALAGHLRVAARGGVSA